jgi:hypothetical protein
MNLATDHATMRKRHRMFVAALLGVVGLCGLTMLWVRELELVELPKRAVIPTISLGTLSYALNSVFDAEEPKLSAEVVVTNRGPRSFSFSPWRADFVRYETSAGWATNRDGLQEKVFSSTIPIPNYFRVRPGDAATGSVISIPLNAQRWQPGYRVSVDSDRKNLAFKLGPRWSKRAMWLVGGSLSDVNVEPVIWGPIIELTDAEKARIRSQPRP